MDDFRSVIHDHKKNQTPQLWIDTSFMKGDMVAIERASYEEEFEVVGMSESTKNATPKTLEMVDSWGYVVPVASNSEALKLMDDEDTPAHLVQISAKDCGGLDFLLLNGPLNLIHAIEENEEIAHNIDTMVIQMGEVYEFSEDSFRTTQTMQFSKEWEQLFQYGRQKILLDPNLVRTLEMPEEVVMKLADLDSLAEDQNVWSLGSLLALYLYTKPQAFILKEIDAHMHHHEEEKGLFHYEEGDTILLATSVNEQAFFDWLVHPLKKGNE